MQMNTQHTQALATQRVRPSAMRWLKQLLLPILLFFGGVTLMTASPVYAQTNNPGTNVSPTPENMSAVNALDPTAKQFCGIVKGFPKSRWVGTLGLLFAIVGAALAIFGGRGGMTWIVRGVGAVVVLPGLVAFAAGFGIGC